MTLLALESLQVAYGGMLIVGCVIGAQLTATRRPGTA